MLRKLESRVEYRTPGKHRIEVRHASNWPQAVKIANAMALHPDRYQDIVATQTLRREG
jgi:hypothetical protein